MSTTITRPVQAPRIPRHPPEESPLRTAGWCADALHAIAALPEHPRAAARIRTLAALGADALEQLAADLGAPRGVYADVIDDAPWLSARIEDLRQRAVRAADGYRRVGRAMTVSAAAAVAAETRRLQRLRCAVQAIRRLDGDLLHEWQRDVPAPA